MVEFGLKLEDNKVAEWSNEYIDYEKLKAILKKAKNASKSCDELLKRRPELVDDIRAEYEAEREEEAREDGTLIVSNSDIALVDGTIDNVEMTSTEHEKEQKCGEELSGDAKDDQIGTEFLVEAKIPPEEEGGEGEATTAPTRRKIFDADRDATFEGGERSYLLSSIKNPEISSRGNVSTETNYGSSKHEPANSSTGSVPSLARSVSGVISYFKTSYAKKCKEAMKYVDDQNLAFSKLLYQELDKINTFYDEKCDDLTQQLSILLESVDKLDGGLTPTKNKEKSNIKEKLQKRFSMMMHHQQDGQSHSQQLLSDSERKLSFVLQHDDEDDDLEEVVEEAAAGNEDVVDRTKMLKVLRESASIKRALKDLHRTAKLLSNFSMMNYTGFVKIIKKFNKTFPDRKGQFNDITGDRVCNQGKVATGLADKMEELYANWFCDGNVTHAQAQMLPKKGDGLSMDWSQFRLGFRLGMCCILSLWVCWDCVWGLVRDGNSTIGGRAAFPVFRACGGLLLVHWFWGVSVFIWSRFRINYIYLFDFNPRIVDTPITIYNDCVDETLVYLVLMLLYYKAGANDIPEILPAGTYPLLLVLYTTKNLILPWRTRAPLWRAIWHVITAPIVLPTFFYTYVADVFTSMVKVFQDILWTLCFVISGDFLVSDKSDGVQPSQWHNTFWYKNVAIPLICLFPLWIRFNQCLRKYADTGQRFPHLANAFKYAMSQTVTLFGAFHPLYLLTKRHHYFTVSSGDGLDDDERLTTRIRRGVDLFQIFWVGIFISSSLYSFFWDVYMDWGLGRPNHRFLGPRLMFPKRFYYYGVVFVDLFLRFMWVLTLVPPNTGASFEIPHYLSAVTMSVELFRRTLWGFFRLEHEHRHNTEGYRRVDFVPLHFSTGHSHKYKHEKERAGWSVLAEVATVTAAVLLVSAASVITAHRASEMESKATEEL